MSIYLYKLASEYVKNFVICLELLFYVVPYLQLILYVRVFWRNTMWCRGIIYVMPYRIKTNKHKWLQIFKNRCMILRIHTRIIYDFLVIIQGSYMISLVSYKDRTKKSNMDSMKSYMILVWNQRNFNPGHSLKLLPKLILIIAFHIEYLCNSNL